MGEVSWFYTWRTENDCVSVYRKLKNKYEKLFQKGKN